MSLKTLNDLEARFDGPIPTRLLASRDDRILAEIGKIKFALKYGTPTDKQRALLEDELIELHHARQVAGIVESIT